MNVETLLETVPVRARKGPPDIDVRALAYDSRRVQPGSLFAALPGLRDDGARYIPDAIERGAVAVVSESPAHTPKQVAFRVVDDARLALAEMACVFHGRPTTRLATVGVTGTNGKTTVSYMLRDMLRAAGREPGMLGTIVYEMGRRVIPASRTTPEAPDLQDMLAQMLRAGCQSAVLEVSSHALLQKRVWGVDFDAAVFTNLSHEHLDYHETMESYFEAKSLLFQGLGRGEKSGTAVVNTDDPWGRRLAERKDGRRRTLTFGVNDSADVRAEEVQMGTKGTRLVLRTPVGSEPLRLRLMGSFNVSNALASAAAALAMDVPLSDCAAVLEQFVAAPGRLEPVLYRAGIHVFVDYAHTDDALAHVLDALRPVTAGRLILVFGCGGNRDRAKRSRMGAVAAKRADYTFLTSDNPREEDPATIIEEIVRGFGESDAFDTILDREQAIVAALRRAEPGDTVLIAGKGHEKYQEFQRTVIPFDDRHVVERLAEREG